MSLAFVQFTGSKGDADREELDGTSQKDMQLTINTEIQVTTTSTILTEEIILSDTLGLVIDFKILHNAMESSKNKEIWFLVMMLSKQQAGAMILIILPC